MSNKKDKKFSFKQLKDERLLVPFKWKGQVLFNLYDISQKDYNTISEAYKEKEFPITIVDGKEVVDTSHKDTVEYNERMDKYRTVSLLKAMTRGEVEFSDDLDECVNDLEDCGIAIFVELQKAIAEVFRFKI